MDAAPGPSAAPSGENSGESLERARFPERFVAFCVDLLAVMACWYAASAFLHAVGFSVPQRLFTAFWLLLLVVLFVAYHTLLNAGGRRTLGKLLLGLRVYTNEGYPLSLGVSLGRALGYLVSNILCLGYLWALVQPQGLALHDQLAGTMVLQTHPKGSLERAVIAIAAIACLLVYVGTAAWMLAAPAYSNMRRVANAKEAILALSRFEENYKTKTGSYTGDLNALAQMYGDQNAFFNLLGKTLDLNTLVVDSDGTHYQIRAQALDPQHTPLLYKGPPALQ